MHNRQTAIFAVAILAAALLVSVAYLLNRDKLRPDGDTPETAYWCLPRVGKGDARCVTGGPNMPDCYGYFDMRGNRLQQGIVPNNDRSATCEGFMPSEHYTFDKDGEYIGIVPVKQ